MNESFDPSLIVFAALAIFVIWKLRSVLGVRVDRDMSGPVYRAPIPGGPAAFPGAPPAPPAPAPAVDPAERFKGLAEPGSRAFAGLEAIAAADTAFTAENFLEGARRAYEMIVSAFAKGDHDTLRRLLSPQVYGQFAAEIEARERRGETMETAVVSIDSVKLEDARAEQGRNEITLRYSAKLMMAVRDKSGEIVSGGLDHSVPAHEVWTFARDPRSEDPNWKLIATQAA